MIKEFISQNQNWRELIQAKGIKIKEDNELAIFNYSLLDGCDFNDPIVKEARGIVLNTQTFEVVCVGFDKFFNYTEPFASEIDWSTAQVLDKMDGSIMKLYFYDGAWQWATNGTIFAKEATNSFGYNFEKLIKKAVNYGDLDFANLNPEFTYIFELTSPLNQIVIHYDETKLWHLGTRSNKTLQEVEVNIGIEKPKAYPITSMAECVVAVEALNTKNDVKFEGYVVHDAQYRRIKVKSPEYFLLHHAAAAGNVTARDILQFLLDDDFNVEKFISDFPVLEPQVRYYQNELENLFEASDRMAENARKIFAKEGQRGLAEAIKKLPLSFVGFWAISHDGAGRGYWATKEFNFLYKRIKKF